MTFIDIVDPEDAEEPLATLYKKVQGPDGRIDNILKAHSLRPASLEGHMALYKNVLHHRDNKTPKWFLETIGVFVSMLNRCGYCIDHHATGMKRLLRDDEKAEAIQKSLESAANDPRASFSDLFSEKEKSALAYARAITTAPADITAARIHALRSDGWTDSEILEINQVSAYFAYANRTVLGLGVTTEGDTLGLSPNNDDNADDWGHR
ncbi:MAG: peroxidase-related enzyme [Pseudomonadota bacterium]